MFEMFLDQVRDDLSVSFGDEVMIRFAEPFFELQIVLDNAVVNDDDASRAVAMWMRVLFSGTAVCGPARVANAVRAVERTQANDLFEVAQFSFGATDFEVVFFVDDRDTGRVVAAILEFTQPIDDERHHLLVSDVANNSTHSI